jgi:membrane-associated phospholipid phosphatase
MWHLALARRWTRARRARLLTGIAATSALIFLALAFLLRRAAGSQLDLAVTTSVQQLDHPALLAAMVAISVLGYSPQNVLVAVATVVGFWLARLRREALFIVATAGAGLISGLAKILVERPRPVGEDIHVLSQLLDYSYPSGHVVGYVSFYGFLFFLTYVLFTRSPVRTAALTLLGALVGLVGLSRIYVGHHWASDVLGGYALGTAYLLILIQLYRVTRPGLEAPAAARSSTDPLAAPSRN